MQFGIGHPPPTDQLQSTCVEEGSNVPNLQTEFNYLDLFKSYGIFSDFVVLMVPTLSPSSPHRPFVVPIIPTSSPSPPEGPHVVPMAVVSVVSSIVSMVSTPCCPRGPCGPHIIPVIPMSSPCHICHPYIVPIAPRRSPCGPHGCGLRGLLHCLHGLHPMLSPGPRGPRHPHVIPVVPMLFPCCLEGPHIIPNPPDTHFIHPHPPGGRGPQISKNAIRFELIEIF